MRNLKYIMPVVSGVVALWFLLWLPAIFGIDLFSGAGIIVLISAIGLSLCAAIKSYLVYGGYRDINVDSDQNACNEQINENHNYSVDRCARDSRYYKSHYELMTENNHLRNLLKQCRPYIKDESDCGCDNEMNLLAEIDKATGEVK